MELDLCGVFCFLIWSSPRFKWLFFLFPKQVNEVGILLIRPPPVKKFRTLDTPKVNEVGILLIRPSPVKKFWALDIPKETGSIGSTLRRVETLWRSIVTCQDLVVREWIVFWDTRTSTGVYLTWCSCYWNVMVLAILAFSNKILIMFWIKTTAEFSKVIGYHQPADLNTNRTVNASCLCEWTERVMCALLSRISPSKLLFFVFMKTYNRCLVSFSNFVIVLTSCRPILSIMIRVTDKSDPPLCGRTIL